MRVALVLFVHLIVTMAKLLRPSGTRGLLAEMLLLKHQLMVLNRPRQRAPNLTTWDRFLLGLACFLRIVISLATQCGIRAVPPVIFGIAASANPVFGCLPPGATVGDVTTPRCGQPRIRLSAAGSNG